MRLLQVDRMRRVAHFLQRNPLLSRLLIGLVRRTRARFSAGVVGVIINSTHQVLIVEHVFHVKYPWGLPGGWLDRSETPTIALKRELMEELGLTVNVQEPLLIESNLFYQQHLDFAFLCTTHDTVHKLSPELLSYRWTERGELPPLNPFHSQAIENAFTHMLESTPVTAPDR